MATKSVVVLHDVGSHEKVSKDEAERVADEFENDIFDEIAAERFLWQDECDGAAAAASSRSSVLYIER